LGIRPLLLGRGDRLAGVMDLAFELGNRLAKLVSFDAALLGRGGQFS
jgi:hypothetical protein